MGHWSRKKGTEDSELEDQPRIPYIGIAYPPPAALIGPEEDRRAPSHHPSWLPPNIPSRHSTSSGNDCPKSHESSRSRDLGDAPSPFTLTTWASEEDTDVESVSESELLLRMKAGYLPTPSLTSVSSSSSRSSLLSLDGTFSDINASHIARPYHCTPTSLEREALFCHANGAWSGAGAAQIKDSPSPRSISPLDEAIKRTEKEYLERFPKERRRRSQLSINKGSCSGISKISSTVSSDDLQEYFDLNMSHLTRKLHPKIPRCQRVAKRKHGNKHNKHLHHTSPKRGFGQPWTPV